ncbi:MAG: GvpL/GvpF family gas vesicle protein [Chloroflexi bacterium]|nr:GvpL/GvpF family gas vesicle protein [Chloroflexota bacterium]
MIQSTQATRIETKVRPRPKTGAASTYLYGVLEGGPKACPRAVGVDGKSSLRLLSYDGLKAVVSDYQGPVFGALPREQLVGCLLAHQRVTEGFLAAQAVLPVKFGTLLDDPQEVLALLAQGHLALKSALASYRDQVELEVAATWDLAQALRKAAQEPEVAQAKLALETLGRPWTVQEQIQLGRLVKEGLDHRRRAYRERMAGFLQPLAAGVAPNALLSEEMVMNMAFLVERGREAEFGRAVERLDDVFKGEIAFRVIGPLPPYSFATVEVERIAPERVAAARQTLGLEGTLTAAEVRRTYRRLAAGEQRREPEGRILSSRLGQLKQAADLLASWCGVKAVSGTDLPAASKGGAGLFALRIGGLRSLEIEAARFGGQALVAP